jgi:hypothetical protein
MIKILLKHSIIVFITGISLFPFFVFAQNSNVCLSKGYTILTINGIFTNKEGATKNKRALEDKLLTKTYNNEPLTVDFLYNPTHGNKVIDLLDAVGQKYYDSLNTIDQQLFNEKSFNFQDADFGQMLTDASTKVSTQKLLLVGHSQGNFYSNTFYEAVADKSGGVPSQSIGVYGVATPASYVAGNGKYITSKNDNIINLARLANTLNVLPENVVIEKDNNSDPNGHSFSEIYLKYESERITREIKESLNNLKNNTIQNENSPCISPPELTITQKVQGAVLASADYVFDKVIPDIQTTYLAFINGTGTMLANVINSLAGRNSATAILSSDQPDTTLADTTSNNSETTDAVQINKTPIAQPKETTTSTSDQNVEITTASQSPANTNSPTITKPGPDVNGRAYSNIGTISPISDTAAPVITINGTNPVDVIKDATYTDAGATALDDTDGTIVVVATGSANTSAVGTYTITYTATDSSGNISTATRTVNVVADTTAPVITILGSSSEVVRKNSVYIDAGATALDNVDGNLTSSIIKSGTFVDTATAGIYTIIYTSTDLSGNTSNMTRTIVVDNGAMLNHPNFATVSGNYAYVVSETSNSFEIIDISNPTTLVHKSSLVHNNDTIQLYQPKAVAVSGNYAYVVSYSDNLNIIDVSNPVLPVIKSTLSNGDGGAQLIRPNFITISGNYAYIVAIGTQNIEIIDISDPLHPVRRSSYYINSLAVPSSVFISGNYMYLTFSALGLSDGGLQIIDISNPSLPVWKGALNHGTDGASIYAPQSILVSGNYAYITSRADNIFEIVDVSDPTAPVHKSKIADGTGGAALSAPVYAFISGSYAYIASFYGDNLEILDISDPATPVHKGSLGNNVNGSAIANPKSVIVSGNYAYIASNTSSALEIVDISDSANPIHVNKILSGESSHTAP